METHSDVAGDRTNLLCAVWQIDKALINVAPAPAFRWIIPLDDRVPRRCEMRSRMTSGRIVAAANVTTGSAQTKVDPTLPYLEALLAATAVWHDDTYRILMCTWSGHKVTPLHVYVEEDLACAALVLPKKRHNPWVMQRQRTQRPQPP